MRVPSETGAADLVAAVGAVEVLACLPFLLTRRLIGRSPGSTGPDGIVEGCASRDTSACVPRARLRHRRRCNCEHDCCHCC